MYERLSCIIVLADKTWPLFEGVDITNDYGLSIVGVKEVRMTWTHTE